MRFTHKIVSMWQTQHHSTVVIIGAGFAWLSSYIQLRKRNPDVSITLFDLRNHFTFIPSLHECLLDSDHLSSIQIDLKKYYGDDFVQAEIQTIQPEHITTVEWDVWTFDYAVIATGSRTNFFDNENFATHSYLLRRPEDTIRLNQKLTTAKHISIIWWWFTGVEVASILALRNHNAHIRLIHSQERLLHRLCPDCGIRSRKRLEKHHVELILGDRVQDIQKDHITLQSGLSLDSDVTILSSGIRINDQHHKPYLTFDWAYNSLESERIYMCGDVAIHWLYSTGHNAMSEWKRIGNLIADQLLWVQHNYKKLVNYDKLVISLGEQDWILSIWWRSIYLPWISWLFKKMIEKKIIRELRNKRFLPF